MYLDGGFQQLSVWIAFAFNYSRCGGTHACGIMLHATNEMSRIAQSHFINEWAMGVFPSAHLIPRPWFIMGYTFRFSLTWPMSIRSRHNKIDITELSLGHMNNRRPNLKNTDWIQIGVAALTKNMTGWLCSRAWFDTRALVHWHWLVTACDRYDESPNLRPILELEFCCHELTSRWLPRAETWRFCWRDPGIHFSGLLRFPTFMRPDSRRLLPF